jgi:MFS transporter, SP family, general alpha glucoside:H+ symporter
MFLTSCTGIPLGIFQTATCVYAVEILPVSLRAYLTSYVSGCWLIGQLLSASVLRGTLHLKAPWAYRVPFATQ